jgi:hypothetical protein
MASACSGAATPTRAGSREKFSFGDAVSITLRSDGNYDVVCKDGRKEVDTADQVQAGQICLPVPTTDPFDPASCPGPALTTAQAISFLDIPNGVDAKQIGTFQVAARVRTCYPGFSCSTWQDATGTVRMQDGTTLDQGEAFAATGTIWINYSSNQPWLQIVSDQSSYEDPAAPGFGAYAIWFDNPLWDFTSTTSPTLETWRMFCYNNCDSASKTVAPLIDDTLIVFDSAVANQGCLRFAASARESKTDSNNNSYTAEYQVVFYGNYSQ